MTNASLEDYLCSLLDPTITSITIQPTVSHVRWRLPSCFSNASLTSGLVGFSAYSLSFKDWNWLPPSLKTLAISDFRLDKVQTQNWPEFFSKLPQVISLGLTQGALTGSAPDALPSSMTSLDLSNNALSGMISDSIFSNFVSGSIAVSLANNRISGTISPQLFSPLSAATGPISLDFSSNSIGGSLPVRLLPYAYNNAYASLSLTNNSLIGSLPASENIFPPFCGACNLRLDSNRLTGSIPSDLFTSSIWGGGYLTRIISLRNNSMLGVIPVSLFNRNASVYASSGSNYPKVTYIFDASMNQISGDIPSSLVSDSTLGASSLTASFASNWISGSIPEKMFATGLSTDQLDALSLDFSSNRLSGSVPSTIFSNCTAIGSVPGISATTKITAKFASNQLAGVFPTASIFTSCPVFSIALDLSNNLLGGTIPPSLLSTQLATVQEAPPSAFPATPSMAVESPVPLAAPSPMGAQPLSPSPTPSLTPSSDQAILPAIISLNLASNLLYGALPSTLFVPATSYSIELILTNNSISGTLPKEIPFFASGKPDHAFAQYTVQLEHNNITGALPENFANMPSNATLPYMSLTLALDYNHLDQPLPKTLCDSTGKMRSSKVSVSVSNNRIGGSIPSTFLSACNSSSIQFYANDNQLQGDIPAMLFANLSVDSLTWWTSGNFLTRWISTPLVTTLSKMVMLDLSRNNLTQIADERTLASLRTMGMVNLSSNPLSNQKLPSGAAYADRASYDFSNCGLQGDLPEFQISACPALFHASNNRYEITSSKGNPRGDKS